ncbi:DUF2017 family protein [Demequina activiva]|uniref:DUF2017 domain-containing protein n=1 Tax=Demequina activiva TaxID=1582364 RepID=A0A919Q017_9MICO|nr:DUF2017 family protein [Demequina activiva]GIG53476.1 hypothetical protein Dac01nite_02280 [Demequina activiva]
MRGFQARGAAAVAELDDEERMVVARIVADVGLLLGGEQFGMADPGAQHARDADDEMDGIFAHLKGLEESLAEPDDPAVLRLLPSASRDDRDVADEFRRLTEGDLRDLKVARLRTMWEQLSEDGPEWEIDAAEAMPTAAALTDVRLVLASRLSLDTDEDADRLHGEIELATHALDTDADDDLGIDPERVWLGMLYQALTWLQESLVQYAMTAEDADE